MLVIHPDECIDCGVCEPECPAEAIKPDTEPGLEEWAKLNGEYSAKWPNITTRGVAPADAKKWNAFPVNSLPSARIRIKSFRSLILLLRIRQPRKAFHEPRELFGKRP